MSQLKKYKRLKYLGKGSYGAAILVELRSNPSQKFVIKEIVIGHLKLAEQNAAKSEAEVLHQMNHSNITMYIESFVENEKLYIVMENADGGDLSSAIQNRKKDGKYWNEEEVMRIFVQICLALQHVHNQNILHRDLKSQNIFLTLKGVVKLGDFGIAKVLDATDDQARTQIGTPYYLSPEICESKPYGRESDVWSLGILLYELIALEMPFQATSLPALVHRICVAEPNYTAAEKRYSAGLIALTKSMLMKDPQKRPSVSQIVKSDFIKTHISRLLSYTLKVGNGGVEMPMQIKPKNLVNLNSDEAEKVIESVHSQIREQESKDVRNQSNREAARIAEREKLRKFRNDMQQARRNNNGNEGDSKYADDGKDDDSVNSGRAVYKPAPRVVAGRDVSPKNGRNLSPKGGRPVSPAPAARDNSPKRNMSPKVSRPLSPKVNRPVSPTPRGRNISPVNARAGAPAAGNAPGERALTPRGQALQRDRERRLAAAAAMKQGYGDNSSQYAQRDARDNLAAHQRPRDDAYRGGNNGYGYPSQQQVQQQQQQQQQALVAKGNSANDYESAARREFFANRAAAQAAKAKVEAYDRYGGEPLGGGGGGGGMVRHAPQGQPAYPSHPSSRRGSEADYSMQAAAAAAMDDDSSVVSRASRQSCDNDDNGRHHDPEARIAAIKAQRDRDRQRENAEKEEQIKQAIEENRDARRQAQSSKSAVAFDIDLSGNGAPSMAAPKAPPLSIARGASRQSLDDKAVASPTSLALKKDNKSPKTQADVPTRLVRANVREEKGSLTPIESDSGKGRTKKSWGPPVAAKDIAKGIVQYSEYSTPTSQMFAPERRKGDSRDSLPGSSASNVTGVDMNKEAYFDDESVNTTTGDTETAGHRREFSRDSIDPALLVGDEDQAVMRRLESKRNSQLEARQQAKEMFKKLREKRRQQSEGKGGRTSAGADAKVSVVHSVVSPVNRAPMAEEPTGVPRAANASPMQLRLMEVISQVDSAKEFVQKAITGSNSGAEAGESSYRSRGESGRSRTNSESKSSSETGSASQANTPQRSNNITAAGKPDARNVAQFPDIKEEEEDDLTSTLDKWLMEQKRGVTTRKKHGHVAEEDAAAAPVEEEGLDGYSTVPRYQRVQGDSQAQAKGCADEVADEKADFYISGHYEGDSKDHDQDHDLDDTMYGATTNGDTASEASTQNMVRGKYMGNDVEVVGLQCMLAQALMGDED